MDYMDWYEKCLRLAQIKAKGGELSAFEKSELEKSFWSRNDNGSPLYDCNVDILPA